YSAVPRLSGGSVGIDPVLAVAPVLALAGLAVLPLRVLPAAARLLDRLSAHGRRLTAALASWQVARRPVRQGGPILLVVLAVGTGTLVLAQHQSWRQSQLDQAAFATGADVRASLATPLPLGRAGLLARGEGVLGVMPVSNFNSGFDVYALDARAAPGTVLLRPDLATLPPAALWRLITPGRTSHGLVLPGPPARLAVTAAAPAPPPAGAAARAPPRWRRWGWGGGGPLPSGPRGPPPPPPAPPPPRAGFLPGPAHPAAGQAGGRGEARYPLRLLGLSLSYQLPRFPVPPSGPTRGITRPEARIAAARATLDVRHLAVSARATGGFAPPFPRTRSAARRP